MNEGNNVTVFISYAREDYDAAERLHQDLKIAGLTSRLDKESLIAGQNWKIAINKAIKNSRFLYSRQYQYQDNTIGHAEVRIGDSVLMIFDAKDEWKPMPSSIYLYVNYTDAAYKRSVRPELAR
jgi:hypothetical protein